MENFFTAQEARERVKAIRESRYNQERLTHRAVNEVHDAVEDGLSYASIRVDHFSSEDIESVRKILTELGYTVRTDFVTPILQITWEDRG
jgi:hypothetical protein